MPPSRRARERVPCGLTNPGGRRQGKLNEASAARGPRSRGARRRGRLSNVKTTLATDISALASMKNVAKCDTWCELQNPVNHRVFERKLRPKPLGQGHVCLGVTHRVAPLARCGGGGDWPPVRARRPKCDPRGDARHDQWWLNPQLACCRRPGRHVGPKGARASDRDPRSGGITR
ncbi:UNVERIFIED_CONTAM: hypothetical protein Slati_1117500 [Sesamum latifolium]|uniref:Uncharacterized protein n=1 Tax=Sesamum latifolium TaxID=2727402 RepID=A0AAW2XDV5_9LAMI